MQILNLKCLRAYYLFSNRSTPSLDLSKNIFSLTSVSMISERKNIFLNALRNWWWLSSKLGAGLPI
jgi:hypothetical protein